MDRWAKKIAIVTGANSGIGFAIANALITKNMVVVGVDIKEDKMEVCKIFYSKILFLELKKIKLRI